MSLKTHAFRLQPQQDLKAELASYCKTHLLTAASLLSGVGSLTRATLRLADATQQVTLEGPFEIVSLTGTLGLQGTHLHISLADRTGQVIGGHLLEGCLIHTTAEIVLLEHLELEFKREFAPETGYRELVVNRKN